MFTYRFEPMLASKLDSKMVPKLVQKTVKFRSISDRFFVKVLGLFRCPLAVFVSIPRLSFMALDPKKYNKH